MDKITGLGANTHKRLLYDAGIVYVNYKTAPAILGATRGGNTIAIEQELRQMPVDGQPGDVKGDKRRIKVAAKLTANIIEMSTAAIRTAIQGTDNAPTGTHDVITRADQVTNGDYFSDVTLVLQKAGTAELFGITLYNALVTSNFEIAGTDNEEPVLSIEFTAHFDVSDLEEEPWEIFNPLEV